MTTPTPHPHIQKEATYAMCCSHKENQGNTKIRNLAYDDQSSFHYSNQKDPSSIPSQTTHKIFHSPENTVLHHLST